MKKSLIILSVILLLLINIVSAGETFTLDFSTNNAYTVGLNDGDRVEFRLKDTLNTILVKKVNQDSIDIATFLHLEDKNLNSKVPLYTNLNSKKFLKLDVEKDGETDLDVVYKGSNKTAALLILQLPLSPNNNLEVFSKSKFEKNNSLKNLLYLFLILIVVFGLLYFIFRGKAKETEKVIDDIVENKTE